MPPFQLRKPKEARDAHRRGGLSYSHRQPRQQHSDGEREEDGNEGAAAARRRRRQTSDTQRQPNAAEAPSPPGTSGALTLAKKARVGAGGGRPVYALRAMAHSSGAEAYFFHHFRVWTCDGLADSSPGSADFWRHYVLPLASQDGLVRTTLAAVGAAHQLFVARSAPKTLAATPWSRKTDEMERATIQQYNVAISGMVARMSAAAAGGPGGADAGPAVETHIVLLCCVLFICFESLMGRYAESIRHFEAGARMLLGPAALQGVRDPATGHHLADMFAHLGVEFSSFLDDEQLAPPLLGPPESYFGDDEARRPFADLTEATTALRAFDLAYIRGGFSTACMLGLGALEETTTTPATMADAEVGHAHTPPSPQHQCRTLAGRNLPSLPSPEATPRGAAPNEHPMAALFEQWEARFERTQAAAAARALSASEARQLGRLRLQQRLWPVIFALDLAQCWGEPMHHVADGAVDAAWWRYLERAEAAAAPLVAQYAALARPTFALDGDLVSALSLLVTTAADPALERRGLDLLRALHRREGVWDSAEIAEMHEAALALGAATLEGACPPDGGIPGLAKALDSLSPTRRLSPTNGLLRVPEVYAAPTPPSMTTTPGGKPGNRWLC